MNFIKATIICLVTIAAIAVAPTASAVEGVSLERINKSVVKIFTVSKRPSYYMPWQRKPQVAAIGSGLIIDGSRILTNAHVVSNNVFIEVKKANDPKKYIAMVQSIGHQCDLALLIVKDKSFFDGTEPLALGELPSLRDSVSAYGFPKGGNEISITQGVVSRIEQMKYSHSGFELLGVQIDAAINPGNSGGPVLIGPKVVGIAMQALRSSDNIGYIIPTPIIRHFLKDVEDGEFSGFPDEGIIFQTSENKSLRRYFNIDDDLTGVLVSEVIYGSAGDGNIKRGDFLTSIDGVKVANDGSAPLNKHIRVSVGYLVQKHYIGEELKIEVIRNGKPVKLKFPLAKSVSLVPMEHEKQPAYFIYGGLVFMPLTFNYLREWGGKWSLKAPVPLIHAAKYGYPSAERREVVFLKSVLADEINIGYHDVRSQIVSKVNNVAIADMAGLVSAVKNSAQNDEFTKIEFENGLIVVLENRAAEKANKGIIARYGIKSDASPAFAR